MKLKRYLSVFFGACALAMLAGCYEPLDITESEMDMVAEYAAGVLVKHGTKSSDVLLNREEQEQAFAELATPTPRPTLTLTPAPTPAESDKDPSSGKEEGGSKDEKPTATPVPDNTELTMQDLTKLLDKKDFFIRYKGYESTKLYQGAGELFAAAGEKQQLVVVKFDITNQSSSGATLELNKGAKKEFVYTLRVDNMIVRPSLTLLEEDIYTSYSATYKAGETKTCVLVFECADNISLDNMLLTVLRDVEDREDSVLIKVN